VPAGGRDQQDQARNAQRASSDADAPGTPATAAAGVFATPDGATVRVIAPAVPVTAGGPGADAGAPPIGSSTLGGSGPPRKL
jgi:hypothetical protein